MGLSELIAGAIFLWVVVLVAGAYYLLVVRPEETAQDVLRRRVRTGGGAVRSTGASLLKEVERLSAFGPLHRLLSGNTVVAAKLRRVIHQSGLKVNGGQVVLGSACLGLGAYVVVHHTLVVPGVDRRPSWAGRRQHPVFCPEMARRQTARPI